MQKEFDIIGHECNYVKRERSILIPLFRFDNKRGKDLEDKKKKMGKTGACGVSVL